jgi:hypothetical protein
VSESAETDPPPPRPCPQDLLKSADIKARFVQTYASDPAWTFRLCSIDDEAGEPAGLSVCMALVGSGINQCDEGGMTPLMYAVQGSYAASKALRDMGASAECMSSARESLLHVAMAGKSRRAAELVLMPVLRQSSGPAVKFLLQSLVRAVKHADLVYLLTREGLEPGPRGWHFVGDNVDEDDAEFTLFTLAQFDLAVRQGLIARFFNFLMIFHHRLGSANPRFVLGMDENVRRRIREFFVGV